MSLSLLFTLTARNLLRHRIFSLTLLLIAALTALAGTLSLIFAATAAPDGQNQANQILGRAAVLVRQAEVTTVRSNEQAEQVLTGVAGGAVVVSDLDVSVTLQSSSNKSLTTTGRMIDWTNGLVRGIVSIREGSYSTGLAVSQKLALDLGVGVGDELTVQAGGQSLVLPVAAIAVYPTSTDTYFVLLAPPSGPLEAELRANSSSGTTRWFLQEDSVSLVGSLRQTGFSVLTREEAAQVSASGKANPILIVVISGAVSLAFSLVGSLSYSRHVGRQVSTLGHLGASRRLRFCVRTSGIVILVILGDLIGYLVGVASASSAVRALGWASGRDLGVVRFPVTQVVGLYVLTIVAALTAGAIDWHPLSHTAEARPHAKPRIRALVLCSLLLATAVTLTAVAPPGSILTIAAAVCATGLWLWIVAKCALALDTARGPITIVIISRVISRSSDSFRAALIGVMLVATSAAALAGIASSVEERFTREYEPLVPLGWSLINGQQLNDQTRVILEQRLDVVTVSWTPAAWRGLESKSLVGVRNIYWDCRKSGASVQTCLDGAHQEDLAPGVAVLPTLEDAESLLGRGLSKEEGESFVAGDGLLLGGSSDVLRTQRIELVSWNPEVRNPSQLLSPVLVAASPTGLEVPKLILSTRTIERIGGVPATASGPTILLIPKAGNVAESDILAALPSSSRVRVQTYTESGPAYVKTAQRLSHFALASAIAGPSLIIVPISVLAVWEMTELFAVLGSLGMTTPRRRLLAAVRAALPFVLTAVASACAALFLVVVWNERMSMSGFYLPQTWWWLVALAIPPILAAVIALLFAPVRTRTPRTRHLNSAKF